MVHHCASGCMNRNCALSNGCCRSKDRIYAAVSYHQLIFRLRAQADDDRVQWDENGSLPHLGNRFLVTRFFLTRVHHQD